EPASGWPAIGEDASASASGIEVSVPRRAPERPRSTSSTPVRRVTKFQLYQRLARALNSLNLRVQLAERRIDVSNSPARARDADPDQQRERAGEFRPSRKLFLAVKLGGIGVDARVKRRRVDRGQPQQPHLGPEKPVVVILFGLGTHQQDSAEND